MHSCKGCKIPKPIPQGDVMTDIEMQTAMAEIDKINAETRKMLAESGKAMAEERLTNKKAKWYEITLVIAVAAVVGAVAAKLMQ